MIGESFTSEARARKKGGNIMSATCSLFRKPIEGYNFSASPYKTLPAIDSVKLFLEVLKKYNHISQKDLVNAYLTIQYMGLKDVIKILGIILPNVKKCSESIYGDDLFKYCIKSHWRAYFHQRGNWWRETSPNALKVIGPCIFSMIIFITGCTPLQAVEYVAEILSVPFSQRNPIQPKSIEGYTFIEQAHAYTKDGTDIVVKDFARIFEPYQESYDFCNKFGKYSLSMKVWREEGVDPLQLFMTRQFCEDNGNFLDTFIAPPAWTNIIYNLHLIHEYPDDIVYIHDEIMRTKDWENPGINTWSGELAYVAEIDWSILKGRIVQYVFDPKSPSSCKIGAELIKIFNEIGTKLEFIAHDED